MMTLDSILAVDKLLTSRIRLVPIGPADKLEDTLAAMSGGPEAEAVVRLIPRIFDVSLDLDVLPELREPTLVLCRFAASALGFQIGWLPLVEEFFDLVGILGRRRRADLKKYPFLFHVEARRQARTPDRQNAYEALALRGHVALRIRESDMHHSPKKFGAIRQLDNLYRYSLAIRRLIQYARVEDLPLPELLHTKLTLSLVEAAFLQAGQALGRSTRKSWNQTLEDEYGRCRALFCEKRPIYPRYRREGYRARIRPLRISPRVSSFVEEVDNRETIITIRTAPGAVEEGESPWDYASAVEVPGNEEQSGAVTFSWKPPPRVALSTPWDAGVAQLPELLALYRGLGKVVGQYEAK